MITLALLCHICHWIESHLANCQYLYLASGLKFIILNNFLSWIKIWNLVLPPYAGLCLCCNMCYKLLPSVNCLEVGRKSIASSTKMNSGAATRILFSLTKTSKFPISNKGLRLSGKVVSKSFVATTSISPNQFMSQIHLLTVWGSLGYWLCQI